MRNLLLTFGFLTLLALVYGTVMLAVWDAVKVLIS